MYQSDDYLFCYNLLQKSKIQTDKGQTITKYVLKNCYFGDEMVEARQYQKDGNGNNPKITGSITSSHLNVRLEPTQFNCCLSDFEAKEGDILVELSGLQRSCLIQEIIPIYEPQTQDLWYIRCYCTLQNTTSYKTIN